jgi:intergrase/recombinase
MLQHFRFPDLFFRRSKNAFVSFETPELLSCVLGEKPKIKYAALDNRLDRLHLGIKTKQLRKLFATRLRTELPQELVDLLQGRISQSVFFKFYYRQLLWDVQQRTVKSIEPMQTELLSLLKNGVCDSLTNRTVTSATDNKMENKITTIDQFTNDRWKSNMIS